MSPTAALICLASLSVISCGKLRFLNSSVIALLISLLAFSGLSPEVASTLLITPKISSSILGPNCTKLLTISASAPKNLDPESAAPLNCC